MDSNRGRGRGDGHEALGKSSSPDLKRLLPAVALATFYVALAPLLVVWELRATGVVRSSVVSVVGVLVLSLAVSSIGAAWWKKRHGSQDVLFGDLIAWSWIRRWRIERRLDEARMLLAGTEDRRVTPVSQARLLRALASSLEERDLYTHGHSRRVARFSVLIAKRMGLPEDMIAKVATAAAVHDVGKINVSPAILNKPGKLTDREFALIKRHPEDSARMARGLGDEQITAIVRHHHERLDGSGYPDGLSGEQVPLGSRIIAVADTFDALTSRRAYRRPNSHKTAMDILARESGTRLDPDAVRAFRGYYSGKRALTLWNGVTLLPERVLSGLSAGFSGGAASTAQVLTATAASTLIGGMVVLSAPPPRSMAEQASSREAAAGTVDTSVPGVRRGSLVSIPALVTADPPSSRRGSRAPGADVPGSGSKRNPRQGASSPAGSVGRGAGGGSGGSSDGGPLPQAPARVGGAVPKLPAANALLPSAPSGRDVLPGSLPGTGGPLPSVPSGGELLPKGAGAIPDPSSLPGKVLGRGLP